MNDTNYNTNQQITDTVAQAATPCLLPAGIEWRNDTPTLNTAVLLRSLGIAVHLVHPMKKNPAMGVGWASAPVLSIDQLSDHLNPANDYNIGVRTGSWSEPYVGFSLMVVDFDVLDEHISPEEMAVAHSKLQELIGDASAYPSVISGSGGNSRHYWMVVPKDKVLAGWRPKKVKCELPPVMVNGVKKSLWEIDFFLDGKQLVIPPSVHPSGGSYAWGIPPFVQDVDGKVVVNIPQLHTDMIAKLPTEKARLDVAAGGNSEVPIAGEAIPVEMLKVGAEVNSFLLGNVARIGGMDGNETLYSVTGRLKIAGYTPQQVFDILMASNNALAIVADGGHTAGDPSRWMWEFGMGIKKDGVWEATSPLNDGESVFGAPIGVVAPPILTATVVTQWAEPQLIEVTMGAHLDNPVFPIDMIPASLRSMSEEISNSVGVDIESPISVGISVVAGAIGKQLMVVEANLLEHYPAIFMVIVAYSGERKSQTYKLAFAPILRWEAKQAGKSKLRLRRHARSVAIVEKEIATLEAKLSEDGTHPELAARKIEAIENRLIDLEASKPVSSRFTTDNSTEEALTKMMGATGGECVVSSAEGRDMVDIIQGKYSNGLTGDGVILKGISGDKISRDRVGEEIVVTDHPCLNVNLFIQPDKFAGLITDPRLRNSGLVPRIWAVQPPSRIGSRLIEAGDLGTNLNMLDPYYEVISTILANRDGNPILDPPKMVLSAEAQEGRRLLHNDIETNLGEEGKYADHTSQASKLTSNIVKLALVFAVVEDPTIIAQGKAHGLPIPISKATWDKAEAVGRYYLYSTLRLHARATGVFRAFGALRILEWLTTHLDSLDYEVVNGETLHNFTLAGFTKGHNPREITKLSGAEKQQMLNLLVDKGWLQAIKQPKSKSPKYYTHPHLVDWVRSLDVLAPLNSDY